MIYEIIKYLINDNLSKIAINIKLCNYANYVHVQPKISWTLKMTCTLNYTENYVKNFFTYNQNIKHADGQKNNCSHCLTKYYI